MENITTEEIKKRFSAHKIKASLPRIKIYEYLVKYKSHPTVDEIYNFLIKDLITLSKTTVYNTLNLFVEKDLIIQILIEENETRYDADINNHGHFKCTSCNTIYDFDYDLSKSNILNLKNFTADEYHTYIKGTCSNCQNN